MERWEEFFRLHGNEYLSDSSMSIERMYQAFRGRLMAELLVDVQNAQHYGRLLMPHPSQNPEGR